MASLSKASALALSKMLQNASKCDVSSSFRVWLWTMEYADPSAHYSGESEARG